MVRTVDFAEMLGDFQHQAVAAVLGLQRVEDRGQVAFELHVDDGADDLGDVSDFVGFGHVSILVTKLYCLGSERLCCRR